jgi:hypothetical protein
VTSAEEPDTASAAISIARDGDRHGNRVVDHGEPEALLHQAASPTSDKERIAHRREPLARNNIAMP